MYSIAMFTGGYTMGACCRKSNRSGAKIILK